MKDNFQNLTREDVEAYVLRDVDEVLALITTPGTTMAQARTLLLAHSGVMYVTGMSRGYAACRADSQPLIDHLARKSTGSV